MNIRRIVAIEVGTYFAMSLAVAAQETKTVSGPVSKMPAARQIPATEQKELTAMLAKRFNADVHEKLGVRGAGTYRFASTQDFFLINRKDLGSTIFETKSYGVGNKPLEEKMSSKEELLPRVEEVLRKAGYEIPDKRFARFQDEYAGAFHDRKALPEGFDPRKDSMHVARTVEFERVVDDVPVFGSELLVGLNPDGSIGRFRMHWPKLSPEKVKEARSLRAAVQEKKWTVPKTLQQEGVEILEVTAGVGHSAFADPAFKSAAVVRVTYRRSVEKTEYPLASTGYKYFDANGREVVFSAFPVTPGTPARLKAQKQKN